MGWKRKVGFVATFTGAMLGTMHIINRVFSYIATADDYINTTIGDSEKLPTKRKETDLLFFLCIILMSVHLLMNGKISRENFQKQIQYILLIY